jgi:hypothetical protein
MPIPDPARTVYTGVIDAAAVLLPLRLDTPEARVMLLAISGQEAKWTYRRQIGGPARGLWQFEKNGGVKGVLNHPSTDDMAVGVCGVRGVYPSEQEVYPALETDDLLACAFARLLLYTDPKPLPKIGSAIMAWDYYLRTWHPGKPHPDAWCDNYSTAVAVVMGS